MAPDLEQQTVEKLEQDLNVDMDAMYRCVQCKRLKKGFRFSIVYKGKKKTGLCCSCDVENRTQEERRSTSTTGETDSNGQ